MTTPALAGMARAYYVESDAEGAAAFYRWLHPEAVMNFNSLAPIVGSDDIVRFILGRRDPIEHVRHRIINVLVDEAAECVGLEIVVEYDSKLGNHADVYGASFLSFAGGQVVRKRVYVDPSPLREMLSREAHG